MVAYGSFRLIFVVLGNIFALDGLEPFVTDFAELMLRPTAGVICGTHSILAFSVRTSFYITMVLAENLQRPAMVNWKNFGNSHVQVWLSAYEADKGGRAW